MPLGTEVGLSAGDFVLDGDPALRERDTANPFFSAHVYCGHGRPSQLLLSSCHNGHHPTSALSFSAGLKHAFHKLFSL